MPGWMLAFIIVVCALGLRANVARRGVDPRVAGGNRHQTILRPLARSGPLDRARRRGGVSGRYARARSPFRILALAVSDHQSARSPSCRRAKSPSWSRRMARRFPRSASSAKLSRATTSRTRRRSCSAGGEKGRQLGILTAGTYRINTALFTVITSAQRAGKRHDAGRTRVAPRAIGPGGHRDDAGWPPH